MGANEKRDATYHGRDAAAVNRAELDEREAWVPLDDRHYGDAIRSVVGASRDVARLTRERDELRAALDRVRALADRWEGGALRWADPLPVPPEVALIRDAIDGPRP